MQENTIEFQLEEGRVVEPDKLVYVLLVDPGEQQEESVERLQKLAGDFRLKRIPVSENLPIRTAPFDEKDYILVYEFTGSAQLQEFLEATRGVYGISGGVIHLESQEEEEAEIKLIADLTEKAKQKADRLAGLMGKSMQELVGMRIDAGPFEGWQAYGSHQKIDRRFVMTAISMQYARHTHFKMELRRKVTFCFRIG